MATASLRAPLIGAPIMSNTQLKPELAEIVRQVRALRTLTKQSGFVTNRTVVGLLSGLSTEDLVSVGEALRLKPSDTHYIR